MCLHDCLVIIFILYAEFVRVKEIENGTLQSKAKKERWGKETNLFVSSSQFCSSIRINVSYCTSYCRRHRHRHHRCHIVYNIFQQCENYKTIPNLSMAWAHLNMSIEYTMCDWCDGCIILNGKSNKIIVCVFGCFVCT